MRQNPLMLMINIHNTIVRVIILIAGTMVLISIIACGSLRKRPSDLSKTIIVNIHCDFVRLYDHEFVHVDDSFKISYFNDLILYQIPYGFDSSIFIKKHDTMEEKIVKEEVRYRFFVYKAGRPTGYRFNSIEARDPQLFSVDSFLNAKAFASALFYDKLNDSLVKTEIIEKTDILIERYIPRIRYDDTYSDSSYLYFSRNMKNIPFTLSPFLDSTRKEKLLRVVLVYNPVAKGKYEFDVPRRQLDFEIKESFLTNPKEMIDLFERVKQLYDN